MSRGYRLLLRLYPAAFRAEYGEEMAAVFAARLADRPEVGPRVALAGEAVLDTLRHAIAAHLDILRQDLRVTARGFRRAPGFALTAVLVVAIGVGANTAAFSVADHVLLRPLPFPESGRLVKLWSRVPGYDRMEVSPAVFRDWREGTTAVAAIGAFHGIAVNLTGDGTPERLEAAAVTDDLLPLLRVPPAVGRLFTAADMGEGAGGTVVLSHGLWRRRFGGDPAILGRRVLLDGLPYDVIGVMPPGFQFPRQDIALWTPLRLDAEAYEDRNNNYLQVLGRLRPGATLAAVGAELAVVSARQQRAFPAEHDDQEATALLLRDEISAQTRLLLLALCGAALCTLLIACANLGSLLLARAIARRRELALRTALGAGRERLVRQLITESIALAALGGLLGLAVARAALPLLGRLVPPTLPGAAEPALDLRVLLFAALVTGLTGLGFGVWPALRAGRDTGFESLREGVGGGGRQRLRGALVVTEVAASVVLLVSAGLLLRALWRIQAVDPGFRTEGVVTLRTALPIPKYERTARRLAFYDRVLADVRALPGVHAAGYASFLPMAMSGGIWPVGLKGASETPRENLVASLRYVTPGYFGALSIPFRGGRNLEDRDTGEAPAVAVVSESFALRYWPGADPIGRSFTFAFQERTVVGIVGDVRVRGPERISEPQVYLPAGQVPDGGIILYTPKDLVVRASGDPLALLPALRDIVARADPEQPISNVRLMEEVVAEQTASRAVQARLLGALAAIAMLLAGVGIHGLLSFSVSARAREIGLRMALGARRADVLRLVLGQGLVLALLGVVPGALLAYAGGRAMQALLASIRPGDAATFAGVVTLCLGMAVAGSLTPALRAVRVDPMTALRAD
jgi:putative ABC transport system permease protein